MNREDLIDEIIHTCTKTKAIGEAEPVKTAALSIVITRDELVKRKIFRHLFEIERAEKKKTKAWHALTLSFEGVDSNRLIEYKEIRAYLKRLFRLKPHLLYFLSPESNLQGILLCLLEIDTGPMGDMFARYQKGRAEFTFYGTDIVAHIRKHIENAVRYANGLKESEAAQRQFIEFILDAIDYERLIEDAEAI
ncbi:hypothetical protein [Paenibacillus sp. Y412MC10]|uniref:hypothetical protein n=1 Tax=Geobacillus sp. (strain Y412MC10) TaxID=481743 RepID=UPI0011AB440D|nr:hypothetical protein [Paenibacillus sp. Y412MC10]